jgi:hypothetical protein
MSAWVGDAQAVQQGGEGLMHVRPHALALDHLELLDQPRCLSGRQQDPGLRKQGVVFPVDVSPERCGERLSVVAALFMLCPKHTNERTRLLVAPCRKRGEEDLSSSLP